MVELVVVLAVAGIISAVALPKLFDLTSYRGRSFRDGVVSALRFAQKTATSHRRTVCVSFTASTVSLSIVTTSNSSDCSTATALPLPNGAASVVSADTTNVVFGAATPALLNFSFAIDGTGADRTLTIAGQPDITVVGATGYVQ